MLSLLESTEASPEQPQLAQLFLAEPVVAVYGQPFVLRAESPPATLGGGRVLQPSPRRLRRRDHGSLGRLGRLRSSDPVERLSAALAFLGLKPWTERRLGALTGLDTGEIEAALMALTASGALVDLPAGPRRTIRILAEYAADLEERALRALARLHAARPRHSASAASPAHGSLPRPGERGHGGRTDRAAQGTRQGRH